MGKYYNILQLHDAAEIERNAVGDLPADAGDNWQTIGACREEPAGAGDTVNVEGGKTLTYSSNIFCPATCSKVDENATVRVLDKKGNVLVTGMVLRFKRYRHYVKIWV